MINKELEKIVAESRSQNLCCLCSSNRHKFFRRPIKEEEVLDFFPFQNMIIACYKRRHAERLVDIAGEERKAKEELRQFARWLKFEHRPEKLARNDTLEGLHHLHWIFV